MRQLTTRPVRPDSRIKLQTEKLLAVGFRRRGDPAGSRTVVFWAIDLHDVADRRVGKLRPWDEQALRVGAKGPQGFPVPGVGRLVHR